jgi:hypothetical protein
MAWVKLVAGDQLVAAPMLPEGPEDPPPQGEGDQVQLVTQGGKFLVTQPPWTKQEAPE